MTKSRLEAFSDGVFAIAITILVLDLRVPARQSLGESLTRALADQWPLYAAYVTSFLVIGIIWINHHSLFQAVRMVSRPVLFLNLTLLMVVSTIPFPTALLAEYLTASTDARVAAVVYSATMLTMALVFGGLYSTTVGSASTSSARFVIGIAMYAATIAVAFVSAPLCLLLHAFNAVYYAFEHVRPLVETSDATSDRRQAS